MGNGRKRIKQTSILNAYDSDYPELVKYTDCAVDLLGRLIDQNGIQIHSITGRVKEKNSLKAKINRTDKAYSQLEEVTDISGIRIITFLPSEVDLIAKLVEGEFDVDEANSIDKRQIIEPDRFGYVSVHYVVSISKERLKLPEYNRYAGKKCEIQIRSILQHAWAEIEHDLGYKSTIEVPKEIKRRFFRLAGLLELADDEFTKINEDLIAYKATVQDGLVKQPETIYIDKTSLELYVSNSPIVHKIGSETAKRLGIEFAAYLLLIGSDHVKSLHFCNIVSIDELNKSLEENEDLIIRFMSAVLLKPSEQPPSGSVIAPSTVVHYLCYILILKQDNFIVLTQYIDWCLPIQKEQKYPLASELTEIYNKIK